jgi:type II secretory pathway pseudopilin PulG
MPAPLQRRARSASPRLSRIRGRTLDTGPDAFTTIEVLVSMVVIAIAVALVAPMYLAMSGSSSTSLSIASANSGIRPALVELQREVTSASALYSPCPSSGTNYSYLNAGSLTSCTSGQSPGGFAVLMYTNITTGSTTQADCSQWRVYNGLLEERFWNPASMPASLGFSNVAAQVILKNTSSQPPFQLAAASGTQAQLLEITFELAPPNGKVVSAQVETSFDAQSIGPYASGTTSTSSTTTTSSSSTTTTSSSTTTTTTVAAGGSCTSTPAIPGGSS